MTARHEERGQTLPMWMFSVLTALTLMFFSMNYAQVLRAQVRAQNAADAAAAAALSVQATQWNKMTTLLYAADVEEWRIRHLLDGLINVIRGNGGCSPANDPATGTCPQVYKTLQQEYYKAVNRYTRDVQLLQSLAPVGTNRQESDARNIVKQLALNCGTAFGGDCAFKYSVIDYSHRTQALQDVGKDAFFMGVGGIQLVSSSIPVTDFTPAQLEIATCALVEPLVKFSFFGIAPKAFTVVGRAAATTATVTEEWFSPGALLNPGAKNSPFQSTEQYAGNGLVPAGGKPRDWYATNFPSQDYTAYPAFNAYRGNSAAVEEFSVAASWWAAIPYKPYTGKQPVSALCPNGD